MCEAIDNINNIIEGIAKIHADYQKIKELCQSLDKEVSNIYHEIESSKDMNARDGYLIYKRLREVLRQRRFIKEQSVIYNSLMQRIKVNEVSDKFNAVLLRAKERQGTFLEYTSNWNTGTDN